MGKRTEFAFRKCKLYRSKIRIKKYQEAIVWLIDLCVTARTITERRTEIALVVGVLMIGNILNLFASVRLILTGHAITAWIQNQAGDV